MSSKKSTIGKSVLVGDKGVGKSSLILVLSGFQFPPTSPAIFETHTTDITIEEASLRIVFHDTPTSDPNYETLRPLVYPNTNTFLIYVPVILVGCKVDLRNDADIIARLKENDEMVVSAEQGLKVAKEIKAVEYIECSGRTNQGIEELIEATGVSILREKKGCRLTHCCIL
ncbi:uncharacterized protein J8A68_003186 [[Candida] subhashii]|uniref:Uncharacterized protein n=1 Tax=[Candida] subhashii TaxID=561895 RepID=A0A8J5UMS9_9ASCO|nr:uncharacterized protein J8A68_003186 [[Candida] subhashii]KAG7663272.1 hypothetical protein J8A68_003186 [[Candida] subhashii]